MRLLIQRVREARVEVQGHTKANISKGLLVFLGIGHDDTEDDLQYAVHKLCGLRIFNDADGKMNLSVSDINGSVMIVSQFTLHASTKKGFRPSFVRAAHPDHAIPLYQQFVHKIKQTIGDERTAEGLFGAMMDVHLINDGPVTIWMDTKDKRG
jgi:D-tyrosyl-tRNA(Tyr) deacylase